jgi:hypothetical protein
MIGRPVDDPLTGLPGSGVGREDDDGGTGFIGPFVGAGAFVFKACTLA